MTARDFFNLVREMREAQKGYFSTRSKDLLSKSKELEAQVDREINRVDTILREKQCPKPPLE